MMTTATATFDYPDYYTTEELEYAKQFDGEFSRLLNSGEPFAADDIRQRIGEPPIEPNMMGALFNSRLYENRDSVTRHGFRRSRVASAKGRMIQVWQRA